MGDVRDLLVQPLQLLVQVARDLLQVGDVDRHPGQLHLRQHGQQRHLEVAEEGRVLEALQVRQQPRRQLHDDAHPVAVEGSDPGHLDLGAALGRLPAAQQSLLALDGSMEDV